MTRGVRLFYPIMGVALLAVSLAGFGPSFFGTIAAGTFDRPWFVHVHGVIMFSWLVLFIAQGAFAGNGALPLHRRLGMAAIPLFAVIWVMSVVVSVLGLIHTPPPIERLIDNIFLLQIFAFVLLPLFFIMALANRRTRPGHHKRYMLFLTFLMMEAAASRIDFLPGMDSPETFYWVQYLYLDLLLVPVVIRDMIRLGRPHPASVIGIGIILVYQAIAVTLWDSALWLGIVDVIEPFLAGLVG